MKRTITAFLIVAAAVAIGATSASAAKGCEGRSPDPSPQTTAVAGVGLPAGVSLMSVVAVQSVDRTGYQDVVVYLCGKKLSRKAHARAATSLAAALDAHPETTQVEKMRVTWWAPTSSSIERQRVLGTDSFPSQLWDSPAAQETSWQLNAWRAPRDI